MHIVCDCPECGLPADVYDSMVMESTDGDVYHVKTKCPAGHNFFLPAEMLEGVEVMFEQEVN